MTDLERLRASVAQHLGLGLSEMGDAELHAVLERRMAAQGVKRAGAYLAILEGPAGKEEAHALGQLLTVGETYFFRGPAQFKVLRESVLPALWRKQNEIRILSAACSSGEEPYSLAMMCHDEGWAGGQRKARIEAVDLDRRSLAKARAGVYSTWSLRQTTAALQRRWLKTTGNEVRLVPDLLGSVHFHERNLLELDGLFEPASFDIVLCRNVLIYFTPTSARAVVDRIESLLVPGGYFFLSETETLRGITSSFELVSSASSFYYRTRERPAPVAAQPAPPPMPASVATPAPPSTSIVLEDMLPLFARERFGEVLAALADAVVPGREDDLLVYRAVAHLGVGAVAEAEAAARRVVVEGEHPADAHMVIALAAEHQGDAAKAREHCHAALYLDPSFALARLHIGRIERREGKLVDARRELRQALELLAHEKEPRIALFGGGFSRDGLVALCKSELTLAEKAR